MARGSKKSYTSKQKRQAEHIEDSAKKRGRSTKTAERIAWATVNKQDHGGKKSGSGRGKARDTSSSSKGGKRSHGGRSTGTRGGTREQHARAGRASHE
jgi:hypothetical protein